MKKRIKVSIIKPDVTIKEAMKAIQEQTYKSPEVATGIALATGKNNKLIGIVTDGDIRRALLRGININEKVEKILNRNPIVFSKDLTPDEIMNIAIEDIKNKDPKRYRKLNTIIVVDEQHRPYDVFSFFELWRKVEIKTKTISVVGLGYVGLTLSLMLAESGFRMIGVDTNKKLIDNLNKKRINIHEIGINSLFERHFNKNFFVKNNFENNESDIYIICVGTPINSRGQIETSPLKKALLYITDLLKEDDLVILRSTVGIGTCRNLVIPTLENKSKLKAGENFHVAFAPERTVEGDALNELRTLPQVIGGLNKKSAELTAKIFNHFSSSIVFVENLEAAEMVKLLNNSYRDLTFSFANETALICDKFGLNSYKVIQAANQDYTRSLIPRPSPGVGGYCLTKDPYIFADSSRKAGYQVKLPLLSRKISNQMIDYVCEKIDEWVAKNKKIKSRIKIFAVGLAFKGEPETADIRNSTSIDIIKKLEKYYKNITVYDPVMKKKEIIKNGFTHSPIKQGFRNADCVLILNNHRSYKNWDIYDLAADMKKPGMIFDTWHIFNEIITEPIDGIYYRGI